MSRSIQNSITLSAAQRQVISSRGQSLQVIACAGSGKTESVSRRVAALIHEGELPESIVAFTFTEKAAAELKSRIYERVEEVKGPAFLGRLGPMFVGTIHGYCFRLLQDHVPRYGNFDVLDEHRHIGFLSREYRNLGLNNLGARHWQPIRDFAKCADVIGNELIPLAALQGSLLGGCYSAYLDLLDRYHFLTFGMIIAKAVEALGDPGTFQRVHGPLRHLIVDEYQDINPAQQQLIELLAQNPVELCVVGDDDQAIYQWRGSDIGNMLTFAHRHSDAVSIKLETNRRSQPEIVSVANNFAETIPARLSKVMEPTRGAAGVQVVTWKEDTEESEAEKIAETVQQLNNAGYRYQDIAILYRSVRTSAPALVRVLEDRGIPYSCGGRTGLFLQPEINLLGETFAWFVGGDWKDERFGPARPANIDHVIAGLSNHFGGNGAEIPGLRKFLADWQSYRLRSNRPVSLVGDFYKLLHFLGAHNIEPDAAEGSARLGAFARFSQVLADFEHVTRRGRYVMENGQPVFRGGRDRGKPYYQKLHNYLLHYARDAYEDFEGEETLSIDAVSILTVHQAKGLEWPVVFLPALTNRRFPSMFAGRAQDWLLPAAAFPLDKRSRYEGGDAEERRLFYVALTRARDAIYLSHFERKERAAKPSPYLGEVARSTGGIRRYSQLPTPPPPDRLKNPEPGALEISFSDIANFDECAYRYRLGRVLGFQQELAIELGYGRALHHVLRQIAEQARLNGQTPTTAEVEQILQREFYLPFADNPTFTRMSRAADMLVERYLGDYSDDLQRVWATERPFEVHFDEGTLAGRADIILDEEDGKIGRLAIVDYKTATDPLRDERYQLQLAAYASAARAEGLEVVAGYLHELKDGTRRSIDVGEGPGEAALRVIRAALTGIRSGQFGAQPEESRCSACEYRFVCRHNCSTDMAHLSEGPRATNTPAQESAHGLVIGRLLAIAAESEEKGRPSS